MSVLMMKLRIWRPPCPKTISLGQKNTEMIVVI
jgi:hypothetical protein